MSTECWHVLIAALLAQIVVTVIIDWGNRR